MRHSNTVIHGSRRNEEKDDLATPDLKYLAVPYLQAEVAVRGAATDMQERLAALQASQQHHLRCGGSLF